MTEQTCEKAIASTHPNAPVTCVDGIIRPRWASAGEEVRTYYDQEWGSPPGSDRDLFEILSLIVFQLGVSWRAVLGKRAGLREIYGGFDPATVAVFGEAEISALLIDARGFRNQRKIRAVIGNAAAMVALKEPLWALLQRYADSPPGESPLPTSTPASTELAAELRSHGFTHLGPVGCFTLLQAVGAVDARFSYSLPQKAD